MKCIKLLLPVLLSLIILSCAQNTAIENIRNYYFPITETPSVYQYEMSYNGNTSPYFEIIWTSVSGTDTLVSKEIYMNNYELFITQQFSLTDKGLFLKKNLVHKNQLDNSEPINSVIQADTVLLWRTNGMVYTLKHSLDDHYLLRKRKYSGHFKNFNLNNSAIQTVLLNDELYQIREAEKPPKSSRKVVFGKNIGKVSEEIKYPSGNIWRIELKNILTINEFNKLKNAP